MSGRVPPEALRCDVIWCGKWARWAYIGDGGDLYLCDEHCANREKFSAITGLTVEGTGA